MGVEFTHNRSFNKHINNIVSKALKTLALPIPIYISYLKNADTRTKLVAYNTLIRSDLEHSSQTWDPSLKKEIKLLGKVQNRALRFVFTTLSLLWEAGLAFES